jgi:outer membrane immunogenic protein
MRKELLAATALSTVAVAPLLCGPASAQTAFEWTGFYIGVNAGANWSDTNADLDFEESSAYQLGFDDNTPIFLGVDFPSEDRGRFEEWPTKFGWDDLGPTIGGGAGYNYQVGQFVFGLEGDVSAFVNQRGTDSWSDMDSFSVDEGKGDVDRDSELSVAAELDWLATVRARAGVAIDRLLIYGTGGLAIGEVSLETRASLEEHVEWDEIPEIPIDKGDDYDAEASWSGKNSDTNVGYVLGIGGEYAATDRVSVKLEGLYYNLGEIEATAKGEGSVRTEDEGTGELGPSEPIDGVQPYEVGVDVQGILARIGVNVKLGR